MNIGSLIENEVRKQQIPITQFADKINCKRNNIYNIFKRGNIDILQLKQISKVLNRNFFKDIAEDINLINESNLNEQDLIKEKAVSQFLNVAPDILRNLGKQSTIVFCLPDVSEEEHYPTPDIGLPDYYITFTIEDTLFNRIGENPLLPINEARDKDGRIVEVCTNLITGTTFYNIKLDYKPITEWNQTLKFAFALNTKSHE